MMQSQSGPAPDLNSAAQDKPRRCGIMIVDESGWRAHDIASAVWPVDTAALCSFVQNPDVIAHQEPSGVLVHDGGTQVADVFAVIERQGDWIPVIAYSQSAIPTRVVDVLKMGAVDFIEWPANSFVTKRRVLGTLAVAEHDRFSRRRSADARRRLTELSARERQVLEQMSEGGTSKLIARNLNISPRTVEVHRSNMMKKLDCDHSSAAIRIALISKLN